MTAHESAALHSEDIKQCCARLYESNVAELLLGESFHPGGLKLTERLGELLGIDRQSRVLDVAAGRGASAIFLAQRFGCEVVGIDFSAANIERANIASNTAGLGARVRFEQADAERLPFADGAFDAVVCECAFCTFPDKTAAAREFARVLGVEGRVGLSDLTRADHVPAELNGLLAWISCIADAQPLESYVSYLDAAGFRPSRTETHDDALTELVQRIRLKLFGMEIITGLKKNEIPGIDFLTAKTMAKAALQAITQGKLGYAIVCGEIHSHHEPVRLHVDDQ